MVRFDLLEPTNLAEALTMLAQYKDKAKIIAGGQSLLVLLKHRQLKPAYLVNIKGLNELDYIKSDNGTLKIGALTIHRNIEKSALIKQKCPMLSELEQVLGCAQTRNWGTIGGNICDATPANDPPAALIALGAKVKLASVRGERLMLLEEFIIDQRRTALEPDEILVEIQVPVMPHTGGVYYKERVRYTDSPIVGVAAVATLNTNGAIAKMNIVMQSVGPTPIRAKKAEALLTGKKATDKLMTEAAELAAEESRRTLDQHGGAQIRRELKQQLVRVLTGLAINEAIERASKVSF